ncbi:MAG: alpha/beta fold hydrolase [Microgenomates group bacterium]
MEFKIIIKNNRNLLLSAVVERPQKNGVFPAIMFLHGFKGYKEEATYTDLAKRFLEHDVASIRFDASGFGDSEGALEDDYRFSNYIEDTEAVYKWLCAQDFVDSNKIGVIGQSMGGAQTILFASNHPELKIVCAISPPDRIGTVDALGRVREHWKSQGFIEEISSRYGKKIKIPYAYLEDAEQYDFTTLAKKIVCPLVVVLGEKDATVLPEQSDAVFAAANEPKTLIRIAEMDHFYKRDEQILKLVNEKIFESVTMSI